MTILLEIAVVAAIVFGVVAVALGRADGMRPAPPDTGEIGVPDGPVTADAIERTRFGLSFRGYRMGEVDAVLDRLRDEIARRDAELDPPAADPDEDPGHSDDGAERLGDAQTWPS